MPVAIVEPTRKSQPSTFSSSNLSHYNIIHGLERDVPVTGEAETGARPQLAEHREGVEAYTGGADEQAAVVIQRPVLAARWGGGAGHVWCVRGRDLGRPLNL